MGEWESIAGRLEELKAVLPDLAELPRIEPATVPQVLSRLAEAVESMGRRRIRDQIQMSSLQEIAESLLQSHDPEVILATLTLYLRQALDLDEVLLLRRLPRNGSCTGFHAARTPGGARSLGLMPWRPEWSQVLPLPGASWSRLSEGPQAGVLPGADAVAPTRSNQTLPPETCVDAGGAGQASDPGRYQIALPLGRSGRAPGGSHAPLALAPMPLGLLCLNPGPSPCEEGLQTDQVARLVEGILQTLCHREQMESEALFRRQLLRSMEDGVLAVDKDGTIVELNAAAGRLLGIQPEAALGRAVDLLSAIAPQLCRDLKSALEGKAGPFARELTLGTDPNPLRVKAASSPLRDEGGEADGVVVNLTDLTVLRAMEEKVHRLDRLAALGRFAAGVAHEIRNPLAGIGAGVEYLSGKLGPDAAVAEDLRFLRTEIGRLDRIVSDLLEYTRPRALDRQWFEAGALVGRVRMNLSPLTEERGVELIEEGENGLLLWADPDRLQQVLLNLVKNAIEVSQPGGQVRVGWSTRPSTEAGAARFWIKDEGGGMSDEEVARALEPFYTTKGNGTGLGLSLSNAIVEQHGGRLLLESKRGHGTTAHFEIPGAHIERSTEDAIVHSDR